MIDNKTIGERLKTVRTLINVNPSRFASDAGVDISQYAKAEKGAKGLGNSKLMDLCSTWGINMDYLLTGKGHPFDAAQSREATGAHVANGSPLTGAHVTLQDHINLLKDYNEKLFTLLNSSLGSLQEGQRAAIAYQKAWVDHIAEKESGGDPDKKEDLKYKFGKLVDDILSGAVVSGIQTGTGKRSKA